MYIAKYFEICINMMNYDKTYNYYPSPTSRDIIMMNPMITPREDSLPLPLQIAQSVNNESIRKKLTMSELQVQCHLRQHRPLLLQQMLVRKVAVAQLTVKQ